MSSPLSTMILWPESPYRYSKIELLSSDDANSQNDTFAQKSRFMEQGDMVCMVLVPYIVLVLVCRSSYGSLIRLLVLVWYSLHYIVVVST